MDQIVTGPVGVQIVAARAGAVLVRMAATRARP